MYKLNSTKINALTRSKSISSVSPFFNPDRSDAGAHKSLASKYDATERLLKLESMKSPRFVGSGSFGSNLEAGSSLVSGSSFYSEESSGSLSSAKRYHKVINNAHLKDISQVTTLPSYNLLKQNAITSSNKSLKLLEKLTQCQMGQDVNNTSSPEIELESYEQLLEEEYTLDDSLRGITVKTPSLQKVKSIGKITSIGINLKQSSQEDYSLDDSLRGIRAINSLQKAKSIRKINSTSINLKQSSREDYSLDDSLRGIRAINSLQKAKSIRKINSTSINLKQSSREDYSLDDSLRGIRAINSLQKAKSIRKINSTSINLKQSSQENYALDDSIGRTPAKILSAGSPERDFTKSNYIGQSKKRIPLRRKNNLKDEQISKFSTLSKENGSLEKSQLLPLSSSKGDASFYDNLNLIPPKDFVGEISYSQAKNVDSNSKTTPKLEQSKLSSFYENNNNIHSKGFVCDVSCSQTISVDSDSKTTPKLEQSKLSSFYDNNNNIHSKGFVCDVSCITGDDSDSKATPKVEQPKLPKDLDPPKDLEPPKAINRKGKFKTFFNRKTGDGVNIKSHGFRYNVRKFAAEFAQADQRFKKCQVSSPQKNIVTAALDSSEKLDPNSKNKTISHKSKSSSKARTSKSHRKSFQKVIKKGNFKSFMRRKAIRDHRFRNKLKDFAGEFVPLSVYIWMQSHRFSSSKNTKGNSKKANAVIESEKYIYEELQSESFSSLYDTFAHINIMADTARTSAVRRLPLKVKPVKKSLVEIPESKTERVKSFFRKHTGNRYNNKFLNLFKKKGEDPVTPDNSIYSDCSSGSDNYYDDYEDSETLPFNFVDLLNTSRGDLPGMLKSPSDQFESEVEVPSFNVDDFLECSSMNGNDSLDQLNVDKNPQVSNIVKGEIPKTSSNRIMNNLKSGFRGFFKSK
ncbi:uncharacterized protein RJT21DRAFT_1106 [Scheffersomyces amazonensis]|uniref:uncharacterized protein n=1 Tax=Scheffersomyces amazonensis TaxID=1078765 RepID=UPI00315CC98D